MRALDLSKNRADLVFDTYNSPCIKDITHEIRGDDPNNEEIYSFGSGQKTPKDFYDLLDLSSFKKEFLRFFIMKYVIKNMQILLVIRFCIVLLTTNVGKLNAMTLGI